MLINVDSSCCERAQNLERTSISIDTRWTSANWNGFDVIKQRTLETWNTQQTLTNVWIFTQTHRHIYAQLQFRICWIERQSTENCRTNIQCMHDCMCRQSRETEEHFCLCVCEFESRRKSNRQRATQCMYGCLYIFELSITIEKAKQIKNYQTIFLHANIIRMEIN